MTVKFFPNDRGNPPGKLADAELHFTADLATGAYLRSLATTLKLAGKFADSDRVTSIAETLDNAGPLIGLKLIGFAIWERRSGPGRTVTFPARQYSVNGERRSFALLRPIVDAADQNRLRDLIVDAYRAFEADLAEKAAT